MQEFRIAEQPVLSPQLITLSEISRKLDRAIEILTNMQSRLEYQLTTPEEKARMKEEAQKILEKLKKEADAELEYELEKRREAGIPRDGDAITPEDIQNLDKY